MLVVLAMMGIFLGLVSATIRPTARDQLRVEAERLAQLLDLAAQESRITGRSIAWTSDESAYRFWRQSADNEWALVRDSDEFRPRTLPQGMRILSLRSEAAGAREPNRLEFSPGGQFFAYTLGLVLENESYSLESSPVGELRLKPGEGSLHGVGVPH